MTSSDLLARVAESMLIFAPMSQVGCWRASEAVTPRRSLAVLPRKGPPDAVSTIRSTESRGWPSRHCRIALCSESMGTISPSPSSAAAMTRAPPATSDSLLARASRCPARRASRVGSRPAAPTRAFRTTSTPSPPATSSIASRPDRQVVPSDESGSGTRSSQRTAVAGRKVRTCSVSASTLRFATRATISKRSGCRPTTSRALRPMDPVEPRIATRITLSPPGAPEPRRRPEW